jgi:hypothetical protein
MVGVGQWREEPTDEEATATVALWGTDRVHPTAAAYQQMADLIKKDLLDTEAQYTNPAKKHSHDEDQRVHLSFERAG